MNNSIGMDYLQEAIVLGIDVIIFGLCLKGYHSHKSTIKALKVIVHYIFYFFVLSKKKIVFVLFLGRKHHN